MTDETAESKDCVARILRDYRLYLEADGKAAKTIESYLGDVRKFLSHQLIDSKRRLNETFRADVTEFLADLRTQQDLKPATFNKVVNSLSCFFSYLVDTGVFPPDRTLVIPHRDRLKIALGSEREVTVLTERQVDQMTAFLNKTHNVTQRDRLIVLFLLYTGCRVSEVVSVTTRDLDLVAGVVTVTGKGGKLREIPLRADLSAEIQRYLSGERRTSRFAESERLFVSQRAPALNRDTVNTLLERLERLGNFPFHLHPHIFRHTFASRLVSRNVPLTTVQRLAGHASVQTTASYYVNTSRKDKQDAVNLL